MQATIRSLVQSGSPPPPVSVLALGVQPYQPIWHAMRVFSRNRTAATEDRFWWLQHHQVYTTGLRERRPPPDINGIPLIATDRGGLRTCHSPGQLVLYPLVNLRRAGLTAASYINLLEQALLEVLAQWGIAAARMDGAPGVYVAGAKIASVGVRITTGNCYHGLALNISNDLRLFDAIVPCGIKGLEVTRMLDHSPGVSVAAVAPLLVGGLQQLLYPV